ncbi:hypothetical protein DV515_00010448, partial [Chloebia gouldiae]
GADGLSEPEGISLKRVAVVEDFFDIIYSMHVESSSEPGKAPKHAGQKKTYRAIAETYAFLPREAVTRFLMSCTECQKRMHFNSNGLEPKESEPPSSLVSGIIDYNMPLTSTYLKQMKLRVMNSQEQSWQLLDKPCDLDLAERFMKVSRRNAVSVHRGEEGKSRQYLKGSGMMRLYHMRMIRLSSLPYGSSDKVLEKWLGDVEKFLWLFVRLWLSRSFIHGK